MRLPVGHYPAHDPIAVLRVAEPADLQPGNVVWLQDNTDPTGTSYLGFVVAAAALLDQPDDAEGLRVLVPREAKKGRPARVDTFTPEAALLRLQPKTLPADYTATWLEAQLKPLTKAHRDAAIASAQAALTG